MNHVRAGLKTHYKKPNLLGILGFGVQHGILEKAQLDEFWGFRWVLKLLELAPLDNVHI